MGVREFAKYALIQAYIGGNYGFLIAVDKNFLRNAINFDLTARTDLRFGLIFFAVRLRQAKLI